MLIDVILMYYIKRSLSLKTQMPELKSYLYSLEFCDCTVFFLGLLHCSEHRRDESCYLHNYLLFCFIELFKILPQALLITIPNLSSSCCTNSERSPYKNILQALYQEDMICTIKK